MEAYLTNDASQHRGSTALRFAVRAPQRVHVNMHVLLCECLEERPFFHRHIHR